MTDASKPPQRMTCSSHNHPLPGRSGKGFFVLRRLTCIRRSFLTLLLVPFEGFPPERHVAGLGTSGMPPVELAGAATANWQPCGCRTGLGGIGWDAVPGLVQSGFHAEMA